MWSASPPEPAKAIGGCFGYSLTLLLVSGLLVLPAGELLASGGPNASAENRLPNFVIILADDLGYGDLSTYGGWIKTPHLDQMAAEGMRLTDFHSNGPVCSPTRAALITGRYQQRAGIPGVVRADPKATVHYHGIQAAELTLGEGLQQAGYTTAMFGKWHLGYYPKYNPVHHGFGRYRGFVSGNIDYFAKIDQAGEYDWWVGDQKAQQPGYVTTLLNRHAVDFISQHRDRPFLLYVAHAAPHYPYQGPEDTGFREIGQPRTLRDRNQDRIRTAYREMVSELDQGVGAILAKLKELQLDKSTLVFFCSDNGGSRLVGKNKPLRGAKGTLWEGGHRVPALAWWPGRVPAGSVNDSLCATVDLMPTTLSLAGVEFPEKRPFDGVDLTAVLTEDGTLRDRKLFWAFNKARAMRDGPWKLVIAGRKSQLFQLAEDLGETNDLAARHPERVQRMSQDLKLWLDQVTANATEQPSKKPLQ